MGLQAKIVNGIVANVIVSDIAPQEGSWVDITLASPTPQIGWGYANEVFSYPIVTPTLSDAKRDKCAAVDALYASTVSTFSWGGHTWQAHQDIKDAAQWAQDAIDGGALAGNLRWHGGSADYVGITLSNQFVTMDAQSVVARAKAMAPKVYNARVKARQHKDAINALGTVAAVEAYDITTGWPA